jgi:D-xylose transport system substrate-binding protein
MHLFAQKRNPLALLMSILTLTMVLAACGSSAGTGTTGSGTASTTAGGKGCQHVGVLLPESSTSPRWETKDAPLLLAALKTAMPSATIDELNAQGSAPTQQSQAEQELTKGACILIVAAHDSQAASAIVEKAKASNVPVIAYDRLIQDKNLNYYVSFDNVKVGELQGQYVADHAKKGQNLVMINGSQTDNNAILFRQGALNKLQPLIDNKTLNLVYTTFTPDWVPATAQTEMEAALTKAANKVDIAYSANDDMANTIIAALKAQHLNGKVLVTGQDATVAGIQNILTGDQSMTVYKAITKEATATAQLAAALSNGTDTTSMINGQTKTSDGAQIPSVLETPVVVDKTNIVSTVIADGYDTKADICKGLPAGLGGIC